MTSIPDLGLLDDGMKKQASHIWTMLDELATSDPEVRCYPLRPRAADVPPFQRTQS